MDYDARCGQWAIMGECKSNKFWMGGNCKRSCGLCPASGTEGKWDREAELGIRMAKQITLGGKKTGFEIILSPEAEEKAASSKQGVSLLA